MKNQKGFTFAGGTGDAVAFGFAMRLHCTFFAAKLAAGDIRLCYSTASSGFALGPADCLQEQKKVTVTFFGVSSLIIM